MVALLLVAIIGMELIAGWFIYHGYLTQPDVKHLPALWTHFTGIVTGMAYVQIAGLFSALRKKKAFESNPYATSSCVLPEEADYITQAVPKTYGKIELRPDVEAYQEGVSERKKGSRNKQDR